MTSELQNLVGRLISKCDEYNLAYDSSVQPVKVGPDCYYFYATPLDDKCHKLGFCKEEKFYALTGGNTIQIMTGDNQRPIKTRKDTHTS